MCTCVPRRGLITHFMRITHIMRRDVRNQYCTVKHIYYYRTIIHELVGLGGFCPYCIAF